MDLQSQDAAMRKRAEYLFQLSTYQAASVVSTVIAGVESQLLVFFNSSPDFTQQPVPVILQYLLEKIRSVALPGFEFPPNRKRSSDDITPWQWRLLEGYWLFTLVISVLCLPTQILLYIRSEEIRAAVLAGVVAILPA
ncbi:hypothetical protein BGY98DRAFT_997925 [Russula aff. rugulosa BPL654]|nr:hypothetical protein BGY98DRAFT_997925 [Russula aff. rugulosa BPL654]